MEEIERARENPRAFSVLYKRYYRDIFVFVYRRLSDKEDTQDIVSVVFTKAMMNLANYQFKGLPFSSWLFRIASNEVSLFFRNASKVRSISIETSGVQRLAVEMESQKIDTYVLAPILQKLDGEEVELIEMRYFEELSMREIGEVLNLTENNVKVKVFRLLEKIRKFAIELGAEEHE
jgi:RNA polymerase sigma-70 factor (ECF subfamily)